MKIGFDLDGTLDASEGIRKLARKLHSSGHKVIVLTGCHNVPVTKQDKKDKKAQLKGLDVPYHKLKVFPNPPGPDKAKWCAKHNVPLLIDNSLSNAGLAPDSTTVLVPWKTITP